MIRVTFRKGKPARALCFDLENRPLAYWYDGNTTSEITAFGWKWSDQKDVWAMMLQPDGWYLDPSEDGIALPPEDALWSFGKLLEEADLVYGHNIVRHDLPMLNANLLRHQLDPLPELTVSDTCLHMPKRKDQSYSLENLAAMYGLKGKKYHMSQPAWEDANKLTPEGVELARKRVISDVLLQEKLRKKLVELDILKPAKRWSP